MLFKRGRLWPRRVFFSLRTCIPRCLASMEILRKWMRASDKYKLSYNRHPAVTNVLSEHTGGKTVADDVVSTILGGVPGRWWAERVVDTEPQHTLVVCRLAVLCVCGRPAIVGEDDRS
ncbi:hypothetical protein Y032_0243g3476 [Ancylostoma ceylanicum]|uniref:Uncharacterized protein n=1 Tax=Ancylostoma ceylanicum TaxID=53326 RepID=A0A016SD92_9BILA|nr:hypothetical protein Y032_0243g3476 [Ancylostoma ceylanicum]